MKESKTDYTLLNSSSPLTTSTSYSPKKVRASCTRLQYVFIITLIVDFISTFAYLSELSFQHFIFVLSNITAEYNIAWNDIDLFFLSIVRVILYLCYFSPYLFKSWYVYNLASSTTTTATTKEHVILSNLKDLKYLRRNIIFMIFFSIMIFIYTMAKCISRLILSKPINNESEEHVASMLFFWFAVGSNACFTTMEIFLCSKLITQTLKATNNFMDEENNKNDGVEEEDTTYNITFDIGREKKDPPIFKRKKYRNKICPSFSGWLDGVITKKAGIDEDIIDEDELDDDPDDSIVKTEGKGKKAINKKKEKNASLSQLIHMSRNDWPLLVIAFLSLIVAAVGQAFIPKLTGNIINSVAHSQNLKMLENASLELILAAVITAIFTAIRGSVFTLAMARLNMRVRIELFASLLKQELAFFDVTKTGKITSRLNADTTKMADQISLNLNVFLRSVVQAILVLVFMFRINLQLSFVTFVSVPIIVFISKVYGQYWRKLTKSTQKKLAEANGVSDAAISSMSTVKYFASELSEEERYTKKLELFYVVNSRSATIYAVYAMIYTALPALATALVLFYGGKLVLEKQMRAGDLVSFMLYQQSLSSAFNTIGSIYSGLAGALGAADKVFELINRKSTIPAAGNHEPNKNVFRGNIEFNNVSFRYPTRKENIVLKNFNLKIKSGDVVALVGPSGGGKSSVLNLLLRLYEPENGDILLDGKPIGQYKHQTFHRLVGIVGQEPNLFARSIGKNIVYGFKKEEEPNEDQIMNAAKLANAHEFIMNFQDKYKTKCGEKGVMLSGGQKQRIAIARALVRQPHVLLLDEATSALDAESEAIVQKALDDIMSEGRRTVIVVAHRLSTIRNANRICVIKDGGIVESGTHDELLQLDGVYKKLVSKQVGKS